MVKIYADDGQVDKALSLFDLKDSVFTSHIVNCHAHNLFSSRELENLTQLERKRGVCQTLAGLIVDNNPNVRTIIFGQGGVLCDYFRNKFGRRFCLDLKDTGVGHLLAKD